MIIMLVILAFVLFGLGGYLVSIYNQLIFTRNEKDKAWANIDVILRQRHDELPKLIAACESYMGYERATLQKVVDARAAYTAAGSVDGKMAASSQVTAAVRGLLAVAENYPQLKASENFQQLQTRISGLEEAIADRREVFNQAVNSYNVSIQEFPQAIVANYMGLTPSPLLQVAEADKADVAIDIKQPS
jgi:LemA protein